MITVSYNIINLNEVRKISDNNNRGEHCFPIVVGQLEMAIYLANRHNIKGTKDV